MSDDISLGGDRLSRRRLLMTGATIAVAGIAGCTSDSDGTEPTEDTTSDTPEPTDAPSPEPTETPSPEPTEEPALTEPIEPTDSDRCAVCNMMPKKFPDWNAQLTLDLDGGTRAFFCSPGCLTAFAAKPGEFVDGSARDQRVGAWAHDFETKDLVDATGAHWVLEENAGRIDAPMMANPLPFDDEGAAEAYVDQYDDLTEHDVVGFDTFDVALSRQFRAKFLPDPDRPSVLEPATVPEDESCGVCKMMPAKFPDANAQLSFEDGGRTFFCSPGCMTAFYSDPGNFEEGRTREGIVGVWDHDYGTKELIDAIAASYVLETDPDRVDLPMMKNPVPYADRSEALTYVDRYDDLTGDDVVALTAFTVDDAKNYRGKFF